MVHKKVGTITLEYDRGDGVKVSEAFQGEFNNVIFGGNVSSLEGTFQGTLNAGTIDAVGNLNIAGRAVALTTVSQLAYANRYSHNFDDDGVWRTVHSLSFTVPSQDTSGGWISAVIQYYIGDQRRDNDLFETGMRILLDGEVIFTSENNTQMGHLFTYFYDHVKYFYHEITANVTSPGTHTVGFQYRWKPNNTNVYPEFYDATLRVDYIRK